MKRITFKVTAPRERGLRIFGKEAEKLYCKIRLDFEKQVIIAEDVEDTNVENVIELINRYYEVSDIVENSDFINSDVENVTDKKTEGIENEKELPGTVYEDEFVYARVDFPNKYLEPAIIKYLKKINWASEKAQVPENVLEDHIYDSIRMLSMKYSGRPDIKFSVGDIVKCDYGSKLLWGETSGDKLYSLICNIATNDGMVYVVPIYLSKRYCRLSNMVVELSVPEDISYYNAQYKHGFAYLEKGRYVNPARFKENVGKATPMGLKKVLEKLATVFDFTGNIPKEEIVSDKKLTLADVIAPALNKVDPSEVELPLRRQIQRFLLSIDMPANDDLLIEAFFEACNTDKTITYTFIVGELKKIFTNYERKDIITKLQYVFKKWLENYPELKQNCKNISIISMLKLFAKKYRETT